MLTQLTSSLLPVVSAQMEAVAAREQAEREELEKRRLDQQQILGRSDKLSFGLKKKATLF